MAVYDYKKVYEESEIDFPTGYNPGVGMTIGETFTVNGGGDNMLLQDDDLLLQDSVNVESVRSSVYERSGPCFFER
ncbi:hypothetical protein, partial [uncultured Paracoccus sp.]|uniref:hypothetical protein n=1 Tax=uncultured Paracoccus sp. TaxID=189685 RepID=UPI002609892D